MTHTDKSVPQHVSEVGMRELHCECGGELQRQKLAETAGEIGMHPASPPPMRSTHQPKILCHINHYFGSASKFPGRSTSGTRQRRERIVKKAIALIQSLPYEIDIRICGFAHYALVPVDIDLSAIGEPRWIVYESIARMFASIAEYDCFLNIEDDILVNDGFVANTLAFNAASEVNEVYLPNRMEKGEWGAMQCADLEEMPGWAGLNRQFQGTVLDVAANPHSGLLLLTAQQMHYAAQRISLHRREKFHGDYNYVQSAYANLHSPFLLWRAKSNPMAHHVVHADNRMHRVKADAQSPLGKVTLITKRVGELLCERGDELQRQKLAETAGEIGTHPASLPPMRSTRQPKILCHINHYFGSTSKFPGRSTSGARQRRERIVKTAIARIQSLPYEIDIRVCGFAHEALVPVDIDLSAIGEPRWIVYESIARMFASIDDYDYFLNIEDDILVNDSLIANILAFNAASEVNEVYLPNRMEQRDGGAMECIDLGEMPGWAGLNREFQGTILDVAENPHSGLFLLTAQQMRYAAQRVSLHRREKFHGDCMQSAYANLHSPFLLWRAKSNPLAHHVMHPDNYMRRTKSSLFDEVMLITKRNIKKIISGNPNYLRTPSSNPIRGMPNISNSLPVARLRYIQSVHESPELRNPDTLVKYFFPVLDRWRCRQFGRERSAHLQNPFYYYLVARTRYYDEVFLNAIRCGTQQIINIGSGTDTRAYRFAHILKRMGVRVIECDKPEAIHAKQRWAKKLGRFDHVEYLPVDLNEDGCLAFECRLAETQTKSLVYMEGVSPYIVDSSFRRLLLLLADELPPGSRIAYDFKLCGVGGDFARVGVARAFRLPKASEEVAAFHAQHGYRLEHIELSSELSTRLLPNLTGLGVTLFSQDGLVQLATGT